VLSGIVTFLNPNQKQSAHFAAGNAYDALMNEVRIFWAVTCWEDIADSVLTGKLQHFSEQKNHLNRSCPQIPRWAYQNAKRGIEAGEGNYGVDANASVPTSNAS
jgi:hypothetical protein